jgi:small subunit ribosomal protein S11
MIQIINLAVRCTSNNTLLHATGPDNKNIIITSGTLGFKGAKRSSPLAAQKAAELMGQKLLENQLNSIYLIFCGFGKKEKKSIIKGLKKKDIFILKIIDRTAIAHNGCRAKKKRRL